MNTSDAVERASMRGAGCCRQRWRAVAAACWTDLIAPHEGREILAELMKEIEQRKRTLAKP
jgi:hypothetical protein